MKITPIAQGTGVPSQSTTQSTDPGKIARAKAIAAGQEAPQETGDQQADRVKSDIKTITMKTNVSTNRDDQVVQNTTPLDNPDTKEQVKETEATRPIDPQVARIVKANRALQVKERELAQREEALKSQNPSGQEDVIAKLKANPLGVLQEAGVTYDQLTEAILANQSGMTPELQQLKSEVKALKEDLTNQLTTRDAQAEQQVLDNIRRDALALTAQGEQFEAIREAKAQNKVVDLIHRTWKKTGEVLDVTEAAELVENQLIEDYTPFAKLKKVQSRLTPVQEQVEQTPTVQKPNTKVMRTLTNRDTAKPIMDRRARAIAAMQGTLLKKG